MAAFHIIILTPYVCVSQASPRRRHLQDLDSRRHRRLRVRGSRRRRRLRASPRRNHSKI
jgi:hypothetical protein